ncbi:MAG: hypothetical protein AUF64_00485 [Chloroflexi bacterium 13_1_20CM_54_36]|nr:MAG: hypothetical protein AUF64_00485 [Chloroflexi bacterium 13_1_20CM_54_36]
MVPCALLVSSAHHKRNTGGRSNTWKHQDKGREKAASRTTCGVCAGSPPVLQAEAGWFPRVQSNTRPTRPVRVGYHLRDQAHKRVVHFPEGGGNIGQGRDESAPSGNEASKHLGKGWEAAWSGNETTSGHALPAKKAASLLVVGGMLGEAVRWKAMHLPSASHRSIHLCQVMTGRICSRCEDERMKDRQQPHRSSWSVISLSIERQVDKPVETWRTSHGLRHPWTVLALGTSVAKLEQIC